MTLLSSEAPTQSYCASFRAQSDKDNYRLFIAGDGHFPPHAPQGQREHGPHRLDAALCLLRPDLGKNNRVQIVAMDGPSITLYANNVKLAQVSDDTFTTGHIALQAQGGSGDTESATVFCFRGFQLAAPSKS